jgi:DNA ligase (NAD+)
MSKNKIVALQNILKKEEFIIKKDSINLNMLTKKKLNDFKKNPESYLNNLSCDELIELIQHFNYSYYIEGISLVGDELYDYVKDSLKKKHPTHPLLNDVGVTVSSKRKLPYYMGSMDKIKNDEKFLNKWIKKYPNDNKYIISDKLDGISGLLHYSPVDDNNPEIKLYTRGDGNTGQDISYLLKFINFIPNIENKEELSVRGELIITKDNFNEIKINNPSLKNIRNTVAGIFNAKKPNLKIVKYIDFVAYECIKPDMLDPKHQFKKLKKLNFKPAYSEIVPNLNVDLLSNKLVSRRDESEYEIDGIIVSHNKYHKRVSQENPKYSFAFKSIITSKKAEVLVLKVVWNLTKDNYLQPVVYFEPINLEGVTIEKATGFNGKFITDNKIGPGSIIVIIRSGDVIPHIQEILKESETGEPSIPTNYNWKWNESKIEFILDDINKSDDTIKEQKYKEMENFILKIKFQRISIGMIKKLFDAGIDNIDKFLNVKFDDLLKIDGIKEKTANNILNAIIKSMTDLDCITLMVASNKLGRGFAERKIKLIIDKYPDIVNKNKKPDIKDLIEIKGIEKKTAEKFVNNFDTYLEFVKNNNIKCIYTNPKLIKNEQINEKVKDLKFIFTGFRSKELEEYIRLNGGKIQTGVNKETDVVVIKNVDAESSKIDKARELNIKILSKEDFEIEYKINKT